MPLRIGIIGGTGLYRLAATEPIELETPFGEVTLHRTLFGKRETFFLPRHGPEHMVPPHKVNHRAHIEALRAAHCDYVIAVNNVGAIDPTLRANSFAVVSDFLDSHRSAPASFFDDRAVHVDFAQPYCPTLSGALRGTGKTELPSVVYAGTDGPRFETKSEIARLRVAGAQVVGMTGVPEAILAHEKGLCYATLCFIGNSAQASGTTAQAIQKALMSRKSKVLQRLEVAVARLPTKKSCRCAETARHAELTLGGR